MTSTTETESALASLTIATFAENRDAFRDSLKAHIGPSPYADKKEGPSSLSDYTPLKKSGKLDKTYAYSEVTPGLGREFYEDARLADILEDDELLRDLAITVSERGVVFFKKQHDLTIEQQASLADRLGQLSGKPKSAGLHIHPTAFTQGVVDEKTGKSIPEVLVLDTRRAAEAYSKLKPAQVSSRASTGFHSDITFEPVTASYAVLRLKETPSEKPTSEKIAESRAGSVGGSGGDTLWASGYGLAEKVSPAFLKYLESKTGEYSQPIFGALTSDQEVPFWSDERGAPENIGTELRATHPLVRTNPVTGWKSVFAIGPHFTSVNGVGPKESDFVTRYLEAVLESSPEIQLRYKWDQYDVAIWDNRSTYHSIIHDLRLPNGEVLDRVGLRTLSLGERPFLDPNSQLRSQALREAGAGADSSAGAT